MLDTDIASYAMRGQSPGINAQLEKINAQRVCVSAVTRGELLFGVRRLNGATILAAKVDRFLKGVGTLPWNDAAADCFASVRAELERRGESIGIMDTMIAAHASALKAVLVTNNEKHFRMVKGLAIQNWSR